MTASAAVACAGIAATLVGSELPTKVGKGVETVSGIEAFLVFAVTAFNLAVVPMRIGTDELVANAQCACSAFKQRWNIPFRVGKTVGKLKAVVGLDTLHFYALAGKCGNHPAQKIRRGIEVLCSGETPRMR